MLVCMVLPDFVVNLERVRPNVPTVVYNTSISPHAIYALCEAARRIGINKAMRKGNARALYPDAQEYVAHPKRYARIANERAMALLELTDRIEVEQTDQLTIWLDVGKASQAEMQTIITYLKAKFAAEPFQMGIANGRSLARIAARTTPRNTIRAVAPGQEKAILAPMRLDQFATTKSFRERCEEFGLYTLADLGHLPYHGVLKRFGSAGGQLHKLYQGDDRQTLERWAIPLREEVRLAFDSPLEDSEIAERVIRRLTETLAKRLQERGLTCSEITLTLECENHTLMECSHTLRKAAQSQKALATELLRLLKKAKITSGIQGIHILCDHLKPPVSEQLDFFGALFGSPEPTVEEIAECLAPRHPDIPAYRVMVAKEHAYQPDLNVTLQSVTAA